MDKECLVEYEGYSLTNELYPDDEGFYKNNFKIETARFTSNLPGASSYTSYRDALNLFYSYINGLNDNV